MGPVKNPPSPQPNQRKDHSSSVSEDMAPAAKSRRLLNSCLLENQKNCLNDIASQIHEDQMHSMDEKKIEETNNSSIGIPYLSENNENVVNTVKKPASLNSISNSTPVALRSDLMKNSTDVTKLPDISFYGQNIDTNGEKLENGSEHINNEDRISVENHNSNTSSAPEEMNSPSETKEKAQSLADWTKDLISTSFELSNCVTDTLSELLTDSNKLCLDNTRQFANTYFSQTASSVDKLIEHVSSQGGQSFNQQSSMRRHCSSVERDHKFFDSYLKPHLMALKREFEVDSDATEVSSDEEMSFPSGAGNMTSGNESSPLPQSPASTISDYSTFSTSADIPQPSHSHIIVEKTFPAERNYLRRRADMHSMWVWLVVKYKSQKKQLKKLNQMYVNYQRTSSVQNSNTRRQQLTRSSSPDSTLTPFTGPPTPLSCETSATDVDNTSCANGVDDASMTSARVRPYVSERTTSSPPRSHASRSNSRPINLTGSNLVDLVLGPSSVQCHCQYPEVYPCILCRGNHVDRELNPSAAAKTTRMQLPPADKIYPRQKLDPSFHDKLSRPSDTCHSLSYDESFVSRRPRLVFLSHSRPQQPSPASYSSQHQEQPHLDQQISSMQPKHQHEQHKQQKYVQQPTQTNQFQHQRHPHQPHSLFQRLDTDEVSSNSQAKPNAKRLEQVLSNGNHADESPVNEDIHRQNCGSSRISAHTTFMRRKRGRRKQHPYSRSSVQHPGSYYSNSNEEHEFNDVMHEDDHRQPSNYCKQRLSHQFQHYPHSRSIYRHQSNQQWHHQQRQSQSHIQHQEQQSQFRQRQHHQSNYHHQLHQRQSVAHSRRGLHLGPQGPKNRLSHQSQQQLENEHNHMSTQHCRGQFNQQKLSSNRHCLSNQQHAQRSKARSSLDIPKATDSPSSSHSPSFQAHTEVTHSHSGAGMRSLVVNIASSANSVSPKDNLPTDSQCLLVRRPSSNCTTVPVASRRPVHVSKMAFLSRGSSIPDEETASVSSSGGSVKSMRSVCSSRLEMRQRSEESSLGLRSHGNGSESLRQSDNRSQTDIETPLWRRLPAGISAAPEEAAMMHLLSVGAVDSVRDGKLPDTTTAECYNSKEFKNLKQASDVTTPYHLVMLSDHQNMRLEDTSDVVYLQRHKAGEVTERSMNVPSNSGSNVRPNSMEELCLQPVTNEFSNLSERLN